MILDSTLLFSDAQAITATAASTNIVDLGATGTPYGALGALIRDVGRGTPVEILVTVTTTFATLTSLTVSIETDDNSGFSSAAIALTGNAVPVATLVAGYQFRVPTVLPHGTNERYLRLKYTVAGSNATAGAVTAAIVAGRQSN
jgi:hypothetical protein